MSQQPMYAVLKKYFGYRAFRKGQEETVEALLSGRDVLAVMPTGAGKSICYQIPALLFEGVTLVVSPLISLMKDQVQALVQSGVPAAYLNSSLTYAQYQRALYNMTQGKYKIIYVAPERLNSKSFLEAVRQIKVSMLAVDEAHCVSQWGQDFRPQYLEIPSFLHTLQNRPVVGAFTATATNRVKADIVDILTLQNPFTITTGFDRPNLYFSVLRPNSKKQKLLELLKTRKDLSGIVYCGTRKNVEEICDLLTAHGFAATRYHAGLLDEERRQNQEDFTYDRKTVMVATNAFGMGIDKSNISYVIHYNMPMDIESYYQEAGRAGRDGEKADCILLYSPKDVRLNKFLIYNSKEQSNMTPEECVDAIQKDEERLKYMTFYATTLDCLRHYILTYFGEQAPEYCGNCINCMTEFETVDMTEDAQKILSCMIRTGQRYGTQMLCDILRGKNKERILAMQLDKQSTFGIMKNTKEKVLRSEIDALLASGYIYAVDTDFPSLRVHQKAQEILRGEKNVTMKVPKKQKFKKNGTSAGENDDLFTTLRELRSTIAKEKHIPAYMIFSNATLLDMCQKKPTTETEFLSVTGVGDSKLQKYGAQFLKVIQEYLENDITAAAQEIEKSVN